MIGPWATAFAYPFRWHHSVLRAADYFLAAAQHDGDRPDPLLAEAIANIRTARRPDGTWLQEHHHPGRAWLEIDVPPNDPSRWLTFYAMRALRQWDEAGGSCEQDRSCA